MATDPPLPPTLLIGCGRMGRAMLDGWMARGLTPSVVVDPAAAAVPGPHIAVADLGGLPAGFAPSCVVLAIKPQVAEQAIEGIGRRFGAVPVLSIVAGRTLAWLERATGGRRIVRAMPNLPASIGRGVTAAVASAGLSEGDRTLAAGLLTAVGRLFWLEDESMLDAVTAVSGSGPAYVFLLAELLEASGVRAGLPAEVARALARGTVAGAAALLEADPADAARLREAVTSKGGTTEAALSVLMRADGWPALLDRAVEAAAARSRALAS